MISLDDIRNLAALARLKLMGDEEATLQKDISGILDYVGAVSQFSGESKEPPLLRNVTRDDVPYKEGAILLGKREALLKAFPTREGDYNVVRKIIQKDE